MKIYLVQSYKSKIILTILFVVNTGKSNNFLHNLHLSNNGLFTSLQSFLLKLYTNYIFHCNQLHIRSHLLGSKT